MKTYHTAPAFSADEFLRIDQVSNSYDAPISYDFTRDLLVAYERHIIEDCSPRTLEELRQYVYFFGSRFLFDCGRIYGIRQERERRRGSAACKISKNR